MKRIMTEAISDLGYALLGLLRQNPCSGYELRKIFVVTAMMSYSDSPGAIYPALRRLEQQGLIRGRIEEGPGLRRRQMFRLTAKGTAELKRWIKRPVTREEVVHCGREVMLRFALSEAAAGPSASVKILESLEAELASYLPSLRQQLNEQKPMLPRSGRLALESGIQGYECLLEWAKYALTTYCGKE